MKLSQAALILTAMAVVSDASPLVRGSRERLMGVQYDDTKGPKGGDRHLQREKKTSKSKGVTGREAFEELNLDYDPDGEPRLEFDYTLEETQESDSIPFFSGDITETDKKIVGERCWWIPDELELPVKLDLKKNEFPSAFKKVRITMTEDSSCEYEYEDGPARKLGSSGRVKADVTKKGK